MAKKLQTNRPRHKKPANGFRQFAETIIIFAAFAALNYFLTASPLGWRIDWPILYIIVIAASYKFRHILLAEALTAAYCLYSGAPFRTDAVETILYIMGLILAGFLANYAVRTAKENAKETEENLEELRQDYDKLKLINEDNVLIKTEYEKRLLASGAGMPRLYDVIKRLMSQEPDKILMETMSVLSELVSTDTVAVYRGRHGDARLRLIGALNEESVIGGKTWNISDMPHIQSAINGNELYQGQIGTEEPAIILPVACGGKSEAVIAIRRLPYESETSYHINLLRTMLLLLRDVMKQALEHEDLLHDKQYIKDTDVLTADAFQEKIAAAKQMAEKGLSEYRVVKLIPSGQFRTTLDVLLDGLRMTDYAGSDGNGGILVLLTNTDAAGEKKLRKRLMRTGVIVRPVTDRGDITCV